MSIIFKEKNCWLVDHNQYISFIYKNVKTCENTILSYELSKMLFCIVKDIPRNRKRKLESLELLDETSQAIKSNFENFILELPLHFKEKFQVYNVTDQKTIRCLSQQLFERTVFNHNGIQGGNDSEEPLKCEVKGEFFLIPHNSRFYCGCILEQCKKLSGQQFDLIIADPPWWNKYIRRLKAANSKLSYAMMYNEDIASIPVRELLAPNGIIAVWCTNAPSHIDAVKNLIFPKWGVKYVATWYWIKVTTDLKPLCDFGIGHTKQPYERLMIGTTGDSDIMGNVLDNNIIVSIPSALHSHKPPITNLLYPYLKTAKPTTLELFARYLLPNTTSVGYEPLKWQHISLYDEISR